MIKKMIALALVSLSCFAAPALAREVSIVTLDQDPAITYEHIKNVAGAQCEADQQFPDREACTITLGRNASFFNGLQLCAATEGEGQWPIYRNGAFDPKRLRCSPFNGASLPVVAGVTNVWVRGDRVIGYEGRF